MGLLDDFAGFVKTPEGYGLLSAIAGGMAGARKGTPWNNVGIGGIAGLTGYSNAIKEQANLAQEAQMQELRQMQIAEAKRNLEEKGKVDDFFSKTMPTMITQPPQYAALANGNGPTIENSAKIPTMPPAGNLDANSLYRAMVNSGIPSLVNTGIAGLSKEDTPVVVGKGGALVSKTGTKLYENVDSGLPWYVNKTPDGKTYIDPAYAEFEKTKAAYGRQPSQPMAPVAYVNKDGNVVWGTINDARGYQAANYNPTVQGNIAGAKKAGAQDAEAVSAANDATSSYPQLLTAVEELRGLSNKATYTIAGKTRDEIVKQVGLPATEGAIAREKYKQTVNDVLLPQLRQTFGAQFTEKEGQRLVGTLGDPDKTPEERNAALDAFISQKVQHIQSLGRRAGLSSNPSNSGSTGKQSSMGASGWSASLVK